MTVGGVGDMFTEQQNTSRAELNGSSDELLSVWGITGHHNLQQMFKGHWNRNWTPHSYCNTMLQWFAVCTLWITNTFHFGCLDLFFLFLFLFFIIVAQYIYNKNNGMVIHIWSCGVNEVFYWCFKTLFQFYSVKWLQVWRLTMVSMVGQVLSKFRKSFW